METVLRSSTVVPMALHAPQITSRPAGRLGTCTSCKPLAARPAARLSSGRCSHLRVQAAATVEKTKTSPQEEVDLAVNAIRFLAIDSVNKANSGHPGLPMGLAPLGYILWNEYMVHNPKNPEWFNRDRFVLSAGHGCMLQYALMHFSGFPIALDDCKQFRQWGSLTPGHPENFITKGVEVTTGPLGQGFCQAVGLALAEAHLAARFNKPDAPKIVDHHTYCIVGDGCCMEGVTNEAASLAGHLGLGNLIVFYDDNKISIDGHTDLAFTERVWERYEALDWHVQKIEDGNHDIEGIRTAIENAKKVTDKPSFIQISTLIGYGSPNKANTHGVHGSPLGTDEANATRENLKWEYGEFEIPKSVYDLFEDTQKRGAAAEQQWNKDLEEYSQKYPEEAKSFKQLISGELPPGWADVLPTFTPEDKGLATRLHSQTMLNALETSLPGFFGGSADLAPSNMTLLKAYGDFAKGQYAEKNIRFGVREHGMASIACGIALHSSGLIPYVATFFIFTDYARAAIRLAALSHAGVIFVTTHDSIGLGEDGPTHQPIEHLMSFRAMPNVLMLRPGDGNETAGAYKVAVENARSVNNIGKARPSILAFSRQGMPNLPGTSIEGVAKGGYIVHGGEEKPDVIFLASGSELNLAVEAAKELEGEGKKARVVSLVSWELFEEQDKSYKEHVLPPDVKPRVSIEAGSTLAWVKYVGPTGIAIGIDSFGASAPAPLLYEKFGITKEAAVEAAKKQL